MCGRYTLVETEQLEGRFALEHEPLKLESHYNIAPGMMLPVIVNKDGNQLKLMKWGLVPFWAKDPKIGYRMINARAESVMSKPSYKHPFHRQRCLVPASGFYEWQRSNGRQPYYFHLKDQPIVAFAGLFDTWKDAEGKELASFTIITTSSNAVVSQVHNRMPVILEEPMEKVWLAAETKTSQLIELLRPFSAVRMTTFPVSKQVNVPEADSENLIKPENFK